MLLGVTSARAKVDSIQATQQMLDNPDEFRKFETAQNELSGALSRLLVVTENYPRRRRYQTVSNWFLVGLQYIRINGTIVGTIVGSAIHLLSMATA